MDSNRINKRDLIPGIIWLIIGAALTIGAYQLKLGQIKNTGPGMMPFILGIIMIFLAAPMILLALKDLTQRRESETDLWAEVDLRRIGAVIATLVIYGFVFERLGFTLTSLVGLFLFFKAVSGEKTIRALTYSVVTVLFLYLLFIMALNTQMPTFSLWNLGWS